MYKISLATLILNFVITPLFDAEMGYYVDASVNSTSWSIYRSTRDFNCEISSSISGNGSFSKLMHIQNFVGIESYESSSSTLPGNLRYDEKVVLRSREGPVSVGTTLKSGSNESTNESVNISSTEFININIDERWPARLASYKNIYYLGPGIRTREGYKNNGDVVATSIESWKLDKESIYRAQINRSVTKVNITSGGVVGEMSANKTSTYSLNLDTIGSSAHLDVLRLDEYGAPKLVVSQDYLGEERMNLNITMNDWISPTSEPKDWLECCVTNDSAKALECPLTPSMQLFAYNSLIL